MTDADIKKALECCSLGDHIGVCAECPFTDICDEDEQALQKNALDLINRQQKKIKKLENIEHFATKTVEKQEKEIERLTIEKDNLIRNYRQCMTEAIKEFAEKFEKKIKDVEFTIGQTWEIQYALKQTLKEMTEVKNNE